jgi:flagella basal body P-ring formation protein FlgA
MQPPRRNHVMRQIAVALLVAPGPGTAAHASGALTDPAQIRQVAEGFVASRAGGRGPVHATAGHLDARLRLPACAGELTPFLSPGAVVRARTSVGVRCASPAWSVYLPVSVESEAPVLVARRSLRRGEVPSGADFDRSQRRVPGLAADFVADPEVLGGLRLRRPIAAGELLATNMLELPPLVRRGQSVTAVTRATGIEVRSSVEALADAAAGDRVRLRNPATGRLIDGTVQPDGTVVVLP